VLARLVKKREGRGLEPATSGVTGRLGHDDAPRQAPLNRLTWQGTTEVTDLFLVGAAVLLVLAGALPALRQPRLP
jgi:hypothetical protein